MSLGFLGSALGSMFFGWLCDKIGCASDRKRESCMAGVGDGPKHYRFKGLGFGGLGFTGLEV